MINILYFYFLYPYKKPFDVLLLPLAQLQIAALFIPKFFDASAKDFHSFTKEAMVLNYT
jgi:hypothetical protein